MNVYTGGAAHSSESRALLSSFLTCMLIFLTRYMALEIHGNCGTRHFVIFCAPPATFVLRWGGMKEERRGEVVGRNE